VGKGSTFTIKLPAVGPGAPGARGQAASEQSPLKVLC